ncbi:N/A [soil metagenome]
MVQVHQTGAIANINMSVKTKRAGLLVGESVTTQHVNEIVVLGWSWGIDQPHDSASGLATARRRLLELIVRKSIDRSSTGLIAAINTNDQIKELTLSMRRAGSTAGDFLVIKLTNARLTSMQLECDDTGQVLEVLHFAYQALEMVQRQQLTTGELGPTTSVTVEMPQAT